ncbi:MAG: hypothetical protein KGH75_08535, partial [Rhodospirillales bacterium]|nr:hypothetical protein [Rhodospirillales bacterium]
MRTGRGFLSLSYAPEGVNNGVPKLHPELAGLLARVASYDSKADAALIDEAYCVAADAHADQKRDNGEPYI